MATSGTSFARAIDGIPVVPNTAARDARFKNPEVDQRVENRETGYIERWDGVQWVADPAIQAPLSALPTAGDADLAATALTLLFTGTVSKALRLDRLAGWIARQFGIYVIADPKYGASPSASAAVNSAAIQAATDDANAAGGGTVLVPPGLFKVAITGGVRALLARANVTLRGAGRSLTTIKVANGQGNYVEVIGAPPDADLTGFELLDLTIDQNTTNNPVAAASDLTTGDKARCAVAVYAGTRIAVRRCRFTDIDSINTVVVNGATVADVEITDNLFDEIGGAVAHDHSTVYTHGSRVTIRGNRFRARAVGLVSAVTAIETHGSAQSVTGNYAWGFKAGANITGVSAASDGVVVTGNSFERVLAGVNLWSHFYGGNVSAPALRDVVIAHNTITLDRDAWPTEVAGAGIGLEANSDAPTRDVQIVHNTIRLLTAAAAGSATDSAGGGVRWWRVNNAIVDENLTIADNTIDGAIAAGVRCDSTFKRLRIGRNTILNPGQGLGAFSDSFRAGVFVAGTVTDVKVSDNLIVDDQGTRTIKYGVYLATAVATNAEALDNVVRYSGAVIPEVQSAAGAGNAWFIRQRMSNYQAPFQPVLHGSELFDTANGRRYRQVVAPSGSIWLRQDPFMAQVGDTSVALLVTDAPVQRFASTLTADRTVTLPSVNLYPGARFRIVRFTGAPGAFTLTVQTSTPTTIKQIPASTNAFVDVEYDGAAWRLTGYGTL